jgi:RloB-like protein
MAAKRRSAGQNRHGLRRPYETRAPRPIVVVVCDDTETARSYFLKLKYDVKTSVTVHVEAAPCEGATAAQVVQHTAELKVLHGLESDESAWALIDMEAEPERQAQARRAKDNAKAKGVSVALSMPCFEIWTLAHLADTGKSFANCAQVVDQLKSEWPKKFGQPFPAKKAQAEYFRLMPLLEIAIERSKRHHLADDQSWSEVYLVVESILSLSKNQ